MKTMIPHFDDDAEKIFKGIMGSREVMSREEIEDVVCDILMRDGPDGHIDGHDVIADFIMSLLEGHGREWAKKYTQQQ